jgi:transcription initiation factor IIE alpha subunit
VYELLKTKELSDEGIAEALNLNPNTSRPRRVELANMGLIVSTKTALTASGRRCQLWRAVPTTDGN